MRFIDTNVSLRHLIDDLPEQSRASTELLLSIESGEQHVFTTHLVINEVIFTLYSFYKLSLEDIRDRVIPLVNIPEIHLQDRHYFERAFQISLEENISYQDAYNAVVMLEYGITEVYSWDRDFDRIEGITRIQPGSASSA